MENNNNNQEDSKNSTGEPLKVKGRGMHPNSLKNMQKAGTAGHNPKGRPKGSRDRATVLRDLIDVKVKRPNPRNPLKQRTMTLYEAAALGIFLSAEKGNALAWKEIQDTLHGPMPQQLKGDFEFTFASLAKDAVKELNGGIDYESGSNGDYRDGNGISEGEAGGGELFLADGRASENGHNSYEIRREDDMGASPSGSDDEIDE